MNRWIVLCADGRRHGSYEDRGFYDADHLCIALDANPYTHCGPHRPAGTDVDGNGVAS